MIAFTIYIGAIMIFYKELPCSCGGIISALSWPAHLIFNGVFILFAIAAIRLTRQLQRSAPK
jgi:hypothetical protein